MHEFFDKHIFCPIQGKKQLFNGMCKCDCGVVQSTLGGEFGPLVKDGNHANKKS